MTESPDLNTRAKRLTQIFDRIVEAERQGESGTKFGARLGAIISEDPALKEQLLELLKAAEHDSQDAGDTIHVGNITDSKAVAVGRGGVAVNVESLAVYKGEDAQAIVRALRATLGEQLVTGFRTTRRLIIASAIVIPAAVLIGVAVLLDLPKLIGSLGQPVPIDFLPPALEEIPAAPDTPDSRFWLRDVAATNGKVWFATREGLVLYTAADGTTEQVLSVDGGVQALALDRQGDRVWFSPSTGGILTYEVGDRQPESVVDEQGTMIDALTLYIADDGDVWSGDLQKGVFVFRDSEWISLPFPQQRSEAFKIEAIAQGSAGPGSIWVTDSIFAFHYDGIEWHLFERNTTEGFAPTGDIRSLLQDGYGHIWIGHGGGVSVLAEGADTVEKPDDVWRQCSNSSTSRMPPGAVTDLALGNGGRDVWIVTESGLARVRTDERLAEDCARWRWDSWPEQNTEDAFWEPNHEFRVAVDESASLSTSTVWIINRQRGRVRRLELP